MEDELRKKRKEQKENSHGTRLQRNILQVDLTNGKFEVEEPSEKFYKKYVGGSALAMYFLIKDMLTGADPLGPDNILELAMCVFS